MDWERPARALSSERSTRRDKRLSVRYLESIPVWRIVHEWMFPTCVRIFKLQFRNFPCYPVDEKD